VHRDALLIGEVHNALLAKHLNLLLFECTCKNGSGKTYHCTDAYNSI
jgi:hypothetical protein